MYTLIERVHMERSKAIEEKLRSLVARIYNDCKGAYGSEDYCYEGQYEDEIRDLAAAIAGEIRE